MGGDVGGSNGGVEMRRSRRSVLRPDKSSQLYAGGPFYHRSQTDLIPASKSSNPFAVNPPLTKCHTHKQSTAPPQRTHTSPISPLSYLQLSSSLSVQLNFCPPYSSHLLLLPLRRCAPPPPPTESLSGLVDESSSCQGGGFQGINK